VQNLLCHCLKSPHSQFVGQSSQFVVHSLLSLSPAISHHR
jgi:hypothetical protein